MTEPLLRVTDLRKSFGALQASAGIELAVMPGTVHALIGPNGAGKSTAIAQMSGELTPDSGTITFDGRDVTALPVQKRAQRGLVRSYQITSLFPDFTAEDNVALAVQAHQGRSFRFFSSARRDRSLRDPARAVLDRVGLLERADVPVTALAHGEQRQLELAMALATAPRMLLLDEPMAGMGQSESRRMMDLLASVKGSLTVLLVEHDMDVVFALADTITVLVKGRAIATGTPADIRADAAVRAAYLGDEAC